MTKRRLRLGVLGSSGLLAGLSLALIPGVASAESPLSFGNDRVIDQNGVLGSQTSELSKKLSDESRQSGYSLRVAYIDTFENPSSQNEWAQKTISQSRFSSKDVLLVIATKERKIHVSSANASAVSSADRQAIYDAARAPLAGKSRPSSQDWAQAAVSASKTLTKEVSPSSQGSSSGPNMTGVIGGAAVAAVGAVGAGAAVYAIGKRRRRERGQATATARLSPQEIQAVDNANNGSASAQDPISLAVATLSLSELRQKADSQLLAADDALRSAEQELEFARIEFGESSAQSLQSAVETARASMQETFTYQQQLDDDIPDTEEQTRQWLGQILRLTESVRSTLGAQTQDLDRLRKMESHVEKGLATIAQDAALQREKLSESRARLEFVKQQYSTSAMLRISDNVEQAGSRLDFVDGALASAKEKIAAGERSQAVVIAQSAEDALLQSQNLLEHIRTTEENLTRADATLNRALADSKAELAEAESFASSSTNGQATDVAASAASLRETISLVERERSASTYDPLDLSERLELSRERLATALAHTRGRAQERQTASEQLDRSLERAQRHVNSARDFIQNRRGGVGAAARTRLSEAMRLFDEALGLREKDPIAGLGKAQRSADLADDALRLADEDLAGYNAQQNGSGLGGLFGQRNSGMGGALLGGVILGSLLDNVFDGNRGGGFLSGGGMGDISGGFGDFGGGFDGGFDIGGDF